MNFLSLWFSDLMANAYTIPVFCSNSQHGNGGDEKPEESEKSGSEVHEGSGDSGENNSY